MKVLLLLCLVVATSSGSPIDVVVEDEKSNVDFVPNVLSGKRRLTDEDAVVDGNPSTYVDAVGSLFVPSQPHYHSYVDASNLLSSSPASPSSQSVIATSSLLHYAPFMQAMNHGPSYYTPDFIGSTSSRQGSPFPFVPGIHTYAWPQMPSLGVPSISSGIPSGVPGGMPNGIPGSIPTYNPWGQVPSAQPQPLPPQPQQPPMIPQQPPTIPPQPPVARPHQPPVLPPAASPQPHPHPGHEEADERHETERNLPPSGPEHETEADTFPPRPDDGSGGGPTSATPWRPYKVAPLSHPTYPTNFFIPPNYFRHASRIPTVYQGAQFPIYTVPSWSPLIPSVPLAPAVPASPFLPPAYPPVLQDEPQQQEKESPKQEKEPEQVTEAPVRPRPSVTSTTTTTTTTTSTTTAAPEVVDHSQEKESHQNEQEEQEEQERQHQVESENKPQEQENQSQVNQEQPATSSPTPAPPSKARTTAAREVTSSTTPSPPSTSASPESVKGARKGASPRKAITPSL